MSIPALGGGANQALQRLLQETAERALADEALLNGEDPAVPDAAAGRNAATAGRIVRRRGTGPSPDLRAQTPDEAILVQLGDADKAERLEVAGGWITARNGPLETKPGPEPKRFDGPDVQGDAEETTAPHGRTAPARAEPQQGPSSVGAAAMTPGTTPGTTPAPGVKGAPTRSATEGGGEVDGTGRTAEATGEPGAPTRPRSDQAATLDRLLVVLKKTGISFRDAYQVLREINAGGTLPPKAQLQARWALADPDAWEARARTEQARGGESDGAPTGRAEQPTTAPAPRSDDADLRRTAVDDVIRDRSWHRHTNAEPDGAGDIGLVVRDDARPTLQSVVRYDATNQAYIAALNTAEFQRLVTILGGTAPDWFWDLRGHRGLRGLVERPTIARLNATRFAGTRLAAWILAIVGMALLWYLGASTGTWW